MFVCLSSILTSMGSRFGGGGSARHCPWQLDAPAAVGQRLGARALSMAALGCIAPRREITTSSRAIHSLQCILLQVWLDAHGAACIYDLADGKLRVANWLFVQGELQHSSRANPSREECSR